MKGPMALSTPSDPTPPGQPPSTLSVGEDAASIPVNSHYHAVQALAKAVDARDGYTHDHSRRVGFYAATLARGLGLDREHVDMVRIAGVLHDVGKIGVRDAILLKPDRLKPEEFAVMRHVPELSHSIVLEAGLPEAAEWVAHVHERIDGRGYPNGMFASEIPIESRILHVADALEAMTCPRIYRRELALSDALQELESNSGSQFDPEVAGLMVRLISTGQVHVGEQPRLGDPSTEALEPA